MKHKIFALMIVILALCLAACGGKEDAAPAADPTTQPTGGDAAPYQDPQDPADELPTGEDPTWPEIEFDWEPAAPSGSFDTTEPTTEASTPEQPGDTNTGNTEQPTEEETSPAERDGVTGNYTPWG